MGTYSLKILFAILVCFLHTQASILGFNSPSHVKCIERERQALLNFKQDLRDDSCMLSTWSNDDNNRDCCKWKGVECTNETGHIHMLDLRGSVRHYLSGDIRITSLLELQNMEYLDLSSNHFSGSHIPEHMGSFKNLRYLNLSCLGFGGRIPYELGNLSNLEYLDLKRNSLDGEIPFQLGNLSQLRYLDLEGNVLDGEIPFQLGNLSQLRYLDLEGNVLDGEIPSQLGNLSQLKYLDLSVNYLYGAIPSQLGKLTSLRYLDLNGNWDIYGEIPSQLGNLSQLRYLDLWYTSLSGAIPFQVGNIPMLHTLRLAGNFDLKINDAKWLSSLSSLTTLGLMSLHNLGSSHFWQQMISELVPNLRELSLNNCSLTDKNFDVPSASFKNSSSSLVTLRLSYNLLKSSVIFHWLFNFTTNLHTLSLRGNLLEGTIPDGFEKVLNSLEFLDLGSNKLQGKIPASLGNICTLQALYLNNNSLSGEISSFIQNSSWCNRLVFQTLDLSDNRITGMLPILSNFTSLRRLDISNNQLNGEIPKSIGLLHELEYLSLEENYLEGDITESHLTNLSKLEVLGITDNSLSLKFGATWVPPFQLHTLGLASCKLGPSFPSWLQTQSHLSMLDISDAGIDDFVPDWFWNKLPHIYGMNMSYNSLKGTIPNLPIKLHTKRYGTSIILNSNQFEGRIPNFLSQAWTLDLSENKISDIHSFLCGKIATTYLYTLDLSNNQIMGQLPDCWDDLNSLEYLDLSNNKLSGKIPQSMGTLVYLQALVLRNNSLIGELPFMLKNCTHLDILDVSQNLLSGPIPSWIGESLQQLKILSLRINHFFGSVPVHICYLRKIHLLDLSRNNLSGRIPTCFSNFTAMAERGVSTSKIERGRKISVKKINFDSYVSDVLLMWKGQDYEFWNPEYILKSIDLSSNDLSGEIPKEVGYLFGLVSLNLARNHLNGEIPSEIGKLTSLDFLDLSRNHLSGKIPSTLSKIDGLGTLNLSNNDLSGRIPWEGHLQTFDASSFEGNPGLCGQQINKSCPRDETIAKPQGPALDDNSVFHGALYMSLGIGFFTGFWGLLGPILLWQPWRIAYLKFLNRLTDYILLTVELNVAKCDRWLKG